MNYISDAQSQKLNELFNEIVWNESNESVCTGAYQCMLELYFDIDESGYASKMVMDDTGIVFVYNSSNEAEREVYTISQHDFFRIYRAVCHYEKAPVGDITAFDVSSTSGLLEASYLNRTELNDAAKLRISRILSSYQWEKNLVDNIDDLSDMMVGKGHYYACIDFYYYSLFFLDSGYVRVQFTEPDGTEYVSYYFDPNDSYTFEAIIDAINGSPSPIENFYDADIEIEDERFSLSDSQIAEIKKLFADYNWVNDTLSSVSPEIYTLKITENNKTSFIEITGAIEFYEDFDSAYNGSPPTHEYVLTKEFKDKFKEIINQENTPKQFNDTSQIKIKYGNGNYIDISSEKNRLKLLNLLNGYEWETNVIGTFNFDDINSLILLISENGEESRFYVNSKTAIEYRSGHTSGAYILKDDFYNQALDVYLDETGSIFYKNIESMNPAYLGRNLSDDQNRKLKDILADYDWINSRIDNLPYGGEYSDNITVLQFGGGDFYLYFYDTGYVRYITPNFNILYKQTEELIADVKNIIVSGYDYDSKLKECLNSLDIYPFSSLSKENVQMIYIPNEYTGTTPFNLNSSQSYQLYMLLTDAGYEKADNMQFKYENLYQFSHKEYYNFKALCFNSEGYIKISFDDYNEFTMKMSAADTEALNAFLDECRQNPQ